MTLAGIVIELASESGAAQSIGLKRIVERMVAERKSARLLVHRLHQLTVVCALSWSVPCLAQASAPTQPTALDPPTEQTEPIAEARDSFRVGAALARQGQWIDALVSFERSYRLHPHPTTLFNIGFCERALGRFTRARKSFRFALAEDAGGQALEPEVANEARGYLEEVERRIVRATVVVRQSNLRLTVNGRPLEAETSQPQGRTFFVAGTRDSGAPEAPPVAVFELLLDPGEQSIVISTGGVDRVVTRHFDAGSTPRIELSAPAGVASTKPRQVVLPAIAYGVGAAGLIVGSVFGVATLGNAKTLSEKCPQRDACPKDAQSDVDASQRNALISNIGFAVGIAGGIVGTWLLFTSKPKESASHNASPSIRAGLGLGHVKFEATF